MSMRHRRLGENNEPAMGNGKNDYLTGVEAVAQAIKTRLGLLYGEWWEDTKDGFPLWQKILGAGLIKSNLDRIVLSRIRGTTGLLSVSSISSTVDPNTRAYTFTAVIDTIYGETNITGGLG